MKQENLQIVRNVLPEAVRTPIRRFADYLGLFAFYPFILIIGYILGDILFLSVAELYFLFLLLGFSEVILKIGTILKYEKFKTASLVIVLAFAIDSLTIIYQVIFTVVLSEIIPLATKLIPMIILGLILHDFSKINPVLKKLDKLGGLIILGSFLLVVQLQITVMLGILFLAIGFAGASQFVRKIAFSTLIGN